MSDLRYDGPDLEADTSGRVQGLLMTGMMLAEGIQAGRLNRTTTGTDQAPATVAPALSASEYAELDDAALARHWTAAADNDDPTAERARRGIEKVLTQRDPETMRDYRSWRNGAGLDPREAMRHALTERETRLSAAWKPLTTPTAAAAQDPQALAAGWVAALGSHHPDAHTAARNGEAALRTALPQLMTDYDTALATPTRTSEGWASGQTTPHAAAQQALGQPLAFGPDTGWADLTTPETETPTPRSRLRGWRHPKTPAANGSAQGTRLTQR